MSRESVPRSTRFCPPHIPVHVIQRGNNKQACFTADKDIRAYAHWLNEGAKKYGVQIHGWVFMTNHIHLLLTPTKQDGLSRLMQHLGRHYVRDFNFRYSRSGTLFDGRFKSSLVQNSDYVLACLRYIELNPVRAGIVRDPGDYRWSSYRSHAYGLDAVMQTPHEQYLALGKDPASRQVAYRSLINAVLPAETLAKIRHCANTGLVLGTQNFRDQVEQLRS